MTRLITIGIIGVLIVLGLLDILFKINNLNKRIEYTHSYRNDFVTFCNELQETKTLGGKTYTRLMQEVNRIQRELGTDGIISVYRDPLAGFQMNNYPIFLNFFNELRNYVTNFYLFEERIFLLISSADESLIKHIGNLEDAIAHNRRKLKNPVFCFSRGINLIISLPVKVFEWGGVISEQSSSKILGSHIHRFLSKLIFIIGLISSIMTIVMDWEEFISILSEIF